MKRVFEWFRALFGEDWKKPVAEAEQMTAPHRDDRPSDFWDFQHCITPHPQNTPYSCTAAVLQCVSAYFGIEVPHEKAVRLTRCDPNGATLEKVARLLQKTHSCSARACRRPEVLRRALLQGSLILGGDCLTYVDEHSILIYGCNEHGFYIMDPAANHCLWKPDSWIFEAGNEFITIRLRNRVERAKRTVVAYQPRPITALKQNGLHVWGVGARLVSLMLNVPMQTPPFHWSSYGDGYCHIPRERAAWALERLRENGVGVIVKK